MVGEGATGLLNSWKEIKISATGKSAPAAGGPPLPPMHYKKGKSI
jgi:hypothetical protein